MLKSSWILLPALMTFSAFGVSFQEKQARVEFLEELSKKATLMNINGYRRELQYEKQNLPLDKRAENEANLLVEQVRIQVMRSYDAALANKSHQDAAVNQDAAFNEVKEAIERDLELLDPSLKEEIREISFKALDDAQTGSLSYHYDTDLIEKSMLKRVMGRHEYLNEEPVFEKMALSNNLPSVNPSKDAERKEYHSKSELLNSIASDRESIRWVSTANITLRSQKMKKSESKVNFQIKAEFLGVEIEAGATVAFKREFSTNVFIMTEGLNPVLLSDDNFDFFKRDKPEKGKLGKIIKKGGVDQRRFVTFNCEVVLDFETDYIGEGKISISQGAKVPGIGSLSVGGSVSKQETEQYSNSINMASRRVMVPEYVGGKSLTFKDLQLLCHEDFLNTQVSKNLTVKDSLNIMMANVVQGLRFSHPKTKCALDKHCLNWFNKEIIGLVRLDNVPRCVEEKRQKYRACELRGLEGQNCSIYEGGKRTSNGEFEFLCDTGLKCVKTQDAGWFKNWNVYQFSKGKCKPVTPKTHYIKII